MAEILGDPKSPIRIIPQEQTLLSATTHRLRNIPMTVVPILVLMTGEAEHRNPDLAAICHTSLAEVHDGRQLPDHC